MNRKYVKLWLLLSVCVLAGCIRDKTDHCENKVTLTYVFEMHYEQGDLFADEVVHLHQYIYDIAGTLVMEQNVSASDMTDGNKVSFILPYGEYTLVT